MLAWVAVFMIGGFLAGCGISICASCYQIVKAIGKNPSQPKPVMQVIKA